MPQRVARRQGDAAAAVHQAERVHAFQPVEHGLTPGEIALQQRLGVAVGAQLHAGLGQRAADLPVVVDFAVEDQRAAAGGVGHGLVRLRLGIKDGEAAEHQRRAGLRQRAAGIGAAVKQVLLHGRQQWRRKRPSRLEESCEAAHGLSVSALGALARHHPRLGRVVRQRVHGMDLPGRGGEARPSVAGTRIGLTPPDSGCGWPGRRPGPRRRRTTPRVP